MTSHTAPTARHDPQHDPCWALLAVLVLAGCTSAGAGPPSGLAAGGSPHTPQIRLAAPPLLEMDAGGWANLDGVRLSIRADVPDLWVDVRPGRNLILVFVADLAPGFADCSNRGGGAAEPVGGFYAGGALRRLPADLTWSANERWAGIDLLCASEGAYRLFAVLATARAADLFFLPDDDRFEEALAAPDGSVRRLNGRPVLVEVPAREPSILGPGARIWGESLPPARIEYVVSNDVAVILRFEE